ncbi:competence protein ComK [Alkalihalobacillus oceani]|uniref:competence protein ComK n=1 Tax=Halalkalibacter oceani TaxID=1653776 RepID=UPI00203C7F9A|nr:competence protein ComK [Halalkalibacter oceani]MCM3760988.1 competence protein ComK [Halalkalibacter oceani]
MKSNYVSTYEIHEETLALYPHRDVEYQTKVIEMEAVYYVKEPPLRIIEQSCKLNGASYAGRREWAAYVTKHTYKLPILIQEQGSIIASPTHSPEHLDCVWILAAHVTDLYPDRSGPDEKTTILFRTGLKLTLPVSYASFRSQLLISRACLGYFQARSMRHKPKNC